MSALDPTGLLRYAVAVGSAVLATLVRVLLDPYLGDHLLYPTFFLAVTFAHWYCGAGPSLVALVLGSLAATYFFVPPRNSLLIHDLPRLVGTLTYFVVGLTT